MASNLLSASVGGHPADSAILWSISNVTGSFLTVGFASGHCRPANVAFTKGLSPTLASPASCCSQNTAFTAS